ncbi:MAG TPA: glycosyltransferase family 39 protein, partial [Verrucomicrobiae bacterium]|nr:glycosyltransferase family 39 protein [Verrucomicrobiae bacterium]
KEFLNLGYLLILIGLVARWIYLASGTIELEKDEAYQWLWSKHLALSYYSKPPGIALIQFVSTHIFGDTEFGVRFFSPLFAAILSFIALRFLAKEIGAKLALILLLIVTATPLLGVGTILMTIDPPLVLCWTWALIAGWRAMQPTGKTRDWVFVGLAMGLGFLCKYTAAAQWVCWALVFALMPATRIHLRKRGPWLALGIFLLCTTPVLIWNAKHGWITVTHVAGDAGMQSHWKFKDATRYFPEFTFTQFGLLNPVFFVGMVWAMFGFWKYRRERPLWVYFFCMSAPLYLGYWLFSLHSRVLPNWPIAAVPGLFCLMVVYWNEQLRRGAKWVKPVLIFGLGIGFIILPFLYETKLIGKVTGNALPTEVDPLRRVRAWKQTAFVVERAREQLETTNEPAFIIADHYSTTGLLSFYLPQARATIGSTPLVYCVDSSEPVSQFYFWPEYRYKENRQAQNAIYVSEVDTYPLEKDWVWKWLTHKRISYGEDPEKTFIGQRQLLFTMRRLQKEFTSVTDLGDREVRMNGRVYRKLHLWACYGLK